MVVLVIFEILSRTFSILFLLLLLLLSRFLVFVAEYAAAGAGPLDLTPNFNRDLFGVDDGRATGGGLDVAQNLFQPWQQLQFLGFGVEVVYLGLQVAEDQLPAGFHAAFV
jgi:hypothetical protein